MIKLTLSLCIAGSVGTVLRVLISQFISKHLSSSFPWGTLTVNLLGCLLAGLCWTWSEQFHWPYHSRLILFAGLLAAFTTFSAFGLESFTLIQKGQWMLALSYILTSNILGISLVYIGTRLAK